ncbi:MAG: DUF2269 family protein [Paracoccaceae bacterium]|nr:MAG: DUF2269 family protein [Paracoccaceae bacterium]
MDLYTGLKFMHVLCAVVWLGGGFAFILLGSVLVARASGDAAHGSLTALIRHTAFIGPRLFMPASLLTLLTGISLVFAGGLGWPAWIVLGLAGIAFTAVLGAVAIGPEAERLAAQGPSVDLAGAQRLMRLGRFDYVVQFAIVFLMVAKPGWGDQAVLGGVALAVLVGAVLCLRPAQRRPAFA